MYANGDENSPHDSQGHDIVGGDMQASTFLHEQHYSIEPVHLDRSQKLHLEVLATLSPYNVRVWSSDVCTLSNRVLETHSGAKGDKYQQT